MRLPPDKENFFIRHALYLAPLSACLVINQTGRFSTGWGDEFFISRPYQIIKSSALSFSVFSFTGRGGTRFKGS